MRPPSPPAWLAPAFLVLIVVAGLAGVWLAMTGALRETYYGSANGVAGELVEGRTAGQTFRAQHDGLSAVDLQLATYSHRLGGVVVLHLRQDVTHTVDLATVRVPGAAIADNAWTRFAFPPIPNSRDQSYYVELEHLGGRPGSALTVYWWLGAGDPYPYGRATLDRAPQDGDLTFGLRYDPPPGALFTDMLRAFAAGVPRRPLALFVLAALALPALLAAMLWGARRGWFDGAPRRRARLGALLTLFALAHGYVYLLATPPWQGPDEFAHYAYSALLAAGVRGDDTSPPALAVRTRIEQNIEAAMDARGFTRTVSWYATPGGPASGFVAPVARGVSTLFFETRQPPSYYQLGAAVLRLYTSDPLALPADIGLYLVRGIGVVCNALVVTLAWACAVIVAPGRRFRPLWLALPLAVALLPMRAFVDSMANNDPLAEAASALVAFGVFAWVTRARPFGRAGLIAAALVLLGAVAAFTAKASTTLGPMLALVGCATVYCIWRTLQNLSPRARRRASLSLLGVGAVCGVALALLVVSSFDASHYAAAWFESRGVRVERHPSPTAHSGSYVGAIKAGTRVYQVIELPPAPAPRQVVFQAWVRPVGPQPTGRITIGIDAGFGPASATLGSQIAQGPTAEAWRPLAITATIPVGVPSIQCYLEADNGAEFDDARLTGAGADQTSSESGPGSLRNGSVESTGLQLLPQSGLSQTVARSSDDLRIDLILDTVLNTQSFDRGAVAGEYLRNEYRSFWGWFGWLSPELQLPEWQYWSLGVLSLLGLLGWAAGSVRAPYTARPLGLIGVLALVFAVTVTLARQMTLRALYDLYDFPQGRYLFVLVIPAAFVVATGLLWGNGARRAEPPRVWRTAAWRTARLVLPLSLGFLIFLDLYALLAIMAPFYYGRF